MLQIAEIMDNHFAMRADYSHDPFREAAQEIEQSLVFYSGQSEPPSKRPLQLRPSSEIITNFTFCLIAVKIILANLGDIVNLTFC